MDVSQILMLANSQISLVKPAELLMIMLHVLWDNILVLVSHLYVPTFFQSSPWSAEGAVCVFQLKGHITPVRTLAFSHDGLALASGGVGGLMNIWSLRVRNIQQIHTISSGAHIHNIMYV